MRTIRLKYRLKLLIDKFGTCKKGDVKIFFFILNDDKCGLNRFPIDKIWEVLDCYQFTGVIDQFGNEIYEGDFIEFQDTEAKVIYFNGGSFGYDGAHDFVTLHDTNLSMAIITRH